VEALDISLSSKYTHEILRLVANLATCFGINTNPDGHQGTNDDHGNAAHMEFVHRLTKLGEATSKKSAFDIEPVDGLSGATIPDYLVALIAVRSPSLKSSLRSKLDTLGKGTQKLFHLNPPYPISYLYELTSNIVFNL
jgi:hypothetical protein